MNNIKIKDSYLNIEEKEISRELIFNSVYSFVSKLPYSMDPYSKDYMPGDLYNEFAGGRQQGKMCLVHISGSTPKIKNIPIKFSGRFCI